MVVKNSTASEPPLRIALFSPDLPDSGSSNGIVTYSRFMRDALKALGHSVLVATPDHLEHPDGRIDKLPSRDHVTKRLLYFAELQRPDGSNPWARLRVFDAFRAAQRAGAQVFEIEESFGWAGRLAGRGIPIVERLHGPHVFVRDKIESIEQKRVGDLREAAELRSFQKVQAITAPTERLLKQLSARYSLVLPISKAIPNPIHSEASSRVWQADLADPDQVLFVGRFDHCKGADVVLRAFQRALKRRPSLKLVMVGPDRGLVQPDGRTIGFNEFAQAELQPQERERIRFLDQQPPERIAKLRRDSAVALVGSRFENFPYSIAEAMAVGMPIVTTNTFGGGEMIRDRRDGRVVAINDVEGMANAVLEVINDRAAAAEMGRSALRRATDWLAPERIASETVELYRQSLFDRRGGASAEI